MSDALEKSLREALRAEGPPPGFAERVLARVNSQTAGQTATRPRLAKAPSREALRWLREGLTRLLAPNQFGWAMALAGIIVAAIAIGWYQQHAAEERAQQAAREEAREKVLYALRLTGEKLAPARRALSELGIGLAIDSARQTQPADAAQ